MAATICRKHRAALGVAYEAGLRVAAVTVGDSQRMLIRARQGWAFPRSPAASSHRLRPIRRDKSLRLIKAIEAEEPRSSLRLRAGAPLPAESDAHCEPHDNREDHNYRDAPAWRGARTLNQRQLRMSLDRTDFGILSLLQNNASLSNKQRYHAGVATWEREIRHCQVNRCEDVCGQSEGDSEPSRCSMDAGFLSPSPEGLRANASIAGCGHEMAPRPEVIVDHRMRRQKPLCLAG